MDDSAFKTTPAPRQTGQKKSYLNDSILESLRDLGTGVGKTVTQDVAGKVATDALSSLFGTPPKQGELKADQAVDFRSDPVAGRPERAPFPAFRRPEVRRPPIVKLEEVNLKQQIEAVRAELAALVVSMKSLNTEIQKAVAEVPVAPGIYHLNFFERLKSILKILREQIEDSRSWLALWTNRKKKMGYWGLYKKHGTKFGLSSERTMATQAG